MAHSSVRLGIGRPWAVIVVGVAAIGALSACDAPFGLGLPTTRSVQDGAESGLTSATTFVIRGSYTDATGVRWTMSLTYQRPGREEFTLTGPTGQVGAIVIGNDAYFTGQAFLSAHMTNDPLSRSLVKAAGNAWWKGSPGLAPQLSDLTDGRAFRATFLGTAATQRTDHVTMDGLPAIELSGLRADVYVRAQPPHYILRVRMKKGVVIDGLREADLDYSNFNRSFQIDPPPQVIDFSNLSTLPPIYTVVSVDTSRCASPCVLSALLKNLGGTVGASAPSTVTFTVTSTANNSILGMCQVQVTPDVGYNATTTVTCTVSTQDGHLNSAALATATADSPGHT